MASFLSSPSSGSLPSVEAYLHVPVTKAQRLTSEAHMTEPPWREPRPSRPYGGEPGARPRARDPGPAPGAVRTPAAAARTPRRDPWRRRRGRIPRAAKGGVIRATSEPRRSTAGVIWRDVAQDGIRRGPADEARARTAAANPGRTAGRGRRLGHRTRGPAGCRARPPEAQPPPGRSPPGRSRASDAARTGRRAAPAPPAGTALRRSLPGRAPAAWLSLAAGGTLPAAGGRRDVSGGAGRRTAQMPRGRRSARRRPSGRGPGPVGRAAGQPRGLHHRRQRGRRHDRHHGDQEHARSACSGSSSWPGR